MVSLRLVLGDAGAAVRGPAGNFTILDQRTLGEAESGTFRNVKWPTLLYGYLFAIRPEEHAARMQIHSRTLRHEREHCVRDQLDAFLGTVISRALYMRLLRKMTVPPRRAFFLRTGENPSRANRLFSSLFYKLGF
jgi:hypothetical protein